MSHRPNTLIPYLIALVTLAAFSNLCFHEFTSWDDVFNLTGNPRMNPPTLDGIAWYWRNPAHGLYIPVTYSVWGALAKLAYLEQPNEAGIHLNPYVFHTVNVLIHVASALLVYAIVRRLLRNDWAACIGALVFALHPVQVEPVAWISGMKDVLCGGLSFAAIWLYLIAVDESNQRRTAFGAYAGATIALILAMLAKPTAMVVPAIAFVLHLWVLRKPLSQALLALWPWLLLATACAVLAKLVQPGHGVPNAPLWARAFVAGDALAFYLYKLVFPLHLGIDYGRRPLVLMQHWSFYSMWIIPAAGLVWAFLIRKRYPHPFAAAMIFVIGVSPVLGLVTFLFQYFSTTADHYLYISMLGVALVAAWIVSRWFNRAVILAGVLILLAFGVRTIDQTRHWRDHVALFSHAIRVNPNSFMARYNLGFIYQLAGNFEQAERLYREGIEIKPNYWEARLKLAELLFATGYDDEAIEHVRRAIADKQRLPPQLGLDVFEDHIKLGDHLMSLNRFDQAADEYRRALHLRPNDPRALQKLREAQQRAGQ